MLLQLFNLYRFAGSEFSNPVSFLCKLNHFYIRNFFFFAFTLSISKNIFGEPIICNSYEASIPRDLLHTVCLVNGTFSKFVDGAEKKEILFFHDYYQWISIVFILQAITFYLPYTFWLQWVRVVPSTIESVDFKFILRQIIQHKGFNLFWKTFALELFYFLHLILQAVSINFFLNDGLRKGYSFENLFPLNVHCNVNYYSGGFETTGKFHCALPLNVVYRTIFKIVIRSFYFVFVLHVLMINFKILLCMCPVLRRGAFRSENINSWWMYQVIENNLEGEKLWKLKKAASDYYPSIHLSKDMEIPLNVII